MRERRSVGLLGATGHVGKVLAAGLSAEYALTLYARRPEIALAFARSLGLAATVAPLAALGDGEHEALINCIGVGDPAAVSAEPARVYEVTCAADKLALDYLAQHPSCRLVNFSSGAAYCSAFEEPASDSTVAALAAGALRPDQHYGLAKLASEGRHRALSSLAIIDLRLFSLFSRHIDSSGSFLMNDVLHCVRDATPLVTGASDHVRDYIAPSDLCALVAACLESERVNDAFDVYSAAPVSKFELLAAFGERFRLGYTVDDSRTSASATGSKPAYFSLSRKASALGYAPVKTSLESLFEESEVLLKTTR